MAQIEKLFDPTGAAVDVAEAALAPRPTSLSGLTVGLLDNTKPNATVLLEELAEVLKRDHGVAATKLYTKDYFGTPMTTELRDQLAAECDVVVTAIGDCGSCSAATVADGILLERAGKPAASICTDSFSPSGNAMAEVQGFPGYDFATIAHPVASLDVEQIRSRVQEALPQILRILGVER
ncbi:UGSC family (seleno)protein [Microbacterium album]|uniref:UGSC-like domain-containing protein n=1 Tax=Microbacterium album TaxID=2053191 RepID=A0A917ID79_9MICO|nr:UGSC family (seleno)protein [Microbacterium album]GGH40931.1 hypothetical protein GCM10010921_13190 [Microbacterium album]